MFYLAISPKVVLATALVVLANFQTTWATVPFNSSLQHLNPKITKEQVEVMAKITASCTSPPSIYPVEECSDSTVVAAGLTQAYKAYNIDHLGPQIAIAAGMSFESGGFRANINHFPTPRPGQGTKSMLLFYNVYMFAYSLKNGGLIPQITKILSVPEVSKTIVTPVTKAEDVINGIPDKQKNEIRALVLGDEYTFLAAPWFLRKCGETIYSSLRYNGYEGFLDYTRNCIGVLQIEAARIEAWCAAAKALKPADMALPDKVCPSG